MNDHFAHKAKEWDKGNIRVQNAKIIADAIRAKVALQSHMKLIDFGVGTGLLGFEILHDVTSMLGVDTSKNMLEKLQEKNTQEHAITPCHQDIIKDPLTQTYDGLISSMTLHHVEDLNAFFTTIKQNLNNDGFIAIADLEEEDGSFHSDNTGVHHFGFNTDKLSNTLSECGYKNIKIEKINTIQKPHREFGIFLLTAQI